MWRSNLYITQPRVESQAGVQLFGKALFDTFCVQNYPELTTVTYEMAAKWSEARPGEGDAYHNRRMSMVKVLSEYILSLGQEAYIPNFFQLCSR